MNEVEINLLGKVVINSNYTVFDHGIILKADDPKSLEYNLIKLLEAVAENAYTHGQEMDLNF